MHMAGGSALLNMNQLRVFYEAARSGSFTGAGKRLFITQPAVTAQVKVLEEHCSLKLFRKKGRRVFLTDEGRTLFEYARKIFEYEQEVEQAIEDMKELKRGILRIGTTKTYARYFMPMFISGFHEAYPGIRIYLDEGSSTSMVQSLLEMKNELAVIAQVEDRPEVRFIPFSREELMLIMAPGHPLARKQEVLLEELADEPIIMKEVGSGTRRRVIGLFEKKRVSPNILMETSNTEFIKQLVQRGDGISFLVREAVAAEIREGKLESRPIHGERLLLDVSIAHIRDQHLSRPAKAFLDTLMKIPARHGSQGAGLLAAEMISGWNKGKG
jgi:DNA-binding transcriptional LysR family regulator